MSSQAKRRVLLGSLTVVLVSAAVWTLPPLRARVKALGVVTGASGIPFPRPWARPVEVRSLELAPGIEGDMYSGSQDAPVLLFVPGATRQGREDSRVVRAAKALAAANRRVFVPELLLYRRTFERKDIERLITSIETLAVGRPIGVLGFSYGASFALIAGADARVARDLSYIAVFGAYYDLKHVIQGITTGSTLLDGKPQTFATVPQARDILTSAAVQLAPDSAAEELQTAIEKRNPAGLPSGARAIYELLTNDDPARVAELITALPNGFKSTLQDFSPAGRVEDLNAPVFILQAKKDAATPWTEALLLERALPRTRLAFVHHFSHVDPPGLKGWFLDGLDAWQFTSWMLEAQE
jgi:pimeloyl-ACP methyl ester carboxylesterase